MMDRCTFHHSWLEGLHENVKVEFLPPCTSLIQPLDQVVIACVKARYHTSVFHLLQSATESDVELREILEDVDGDQDPPTIDDPAEDAVEAPELL